MAEHLLEHQGSIVPLAFAEKIAEESYEDQRGIGPPTARLIKAFLRGKLEKVLKAGKGIWVLVLEFKPFHKTLSPV